jgi:hypothetical protein
MRHRFLVLSAIVLMTACNSKPQSKPEESNTKLNDSLRFAADTTGLSEYQQWKAQHELGDQKEAAEQKDAEASTPHSEKSKPATHKSSASSPAAASAPSESGSASSESGNTAQAKKGWSKTAKGAVIGGVVGAGAGAVIDKKNRAAGAVIGGALGAGAGAIIGHDMDKKDGRH